MIGRYGFYDQEEGIYVNNFYFKDVTDMNEINATRSMLKKRALAHPDRRMALFYAFAGHGIQRLGNQHLIINQFNKKEGFYKMWNTEYDIRVMAEKYPNTYSCAVYACCREIYSNKHHTGRYGGTKDEAIAYFAKVLAEELEAKEAVDTAKKAKASRLIAERQEERLNQILGQDDANQEMTSK